MSKNIIAETIANVVSNSKVLNDFCHDPQPWNDYAEKLKDRSSAYHNDSYHNDSLSEDRVCSCANCMHCLGLSYRDFM